MGKMARGDSMGNVKAGRDIESVRVYNGDHYSFSETTQDKEAQSGLKRSRTASEGQAAMGHYPQPSRSARSEAAKAAEARLAAGASAKGEDDIDSTSLAVKRAKKGAELATENPFPTENHAQLPPQRPSAQPRRSSQHVEPNPSGPSGNILRELPGNVIRGRGTTTRQDDKLALDVTTRQLEARLTISDEIDAADALVEAAMIEYDNITEECKRLGQSGPAGADQKVLEAAFRRQKRAEETMNRALQEMALLRRKLSRAKSAAATGGRAAGDHPMEGGLNTAASGGAPGRSTVGQSTPPAAAAAAFAHPATAPVPSPRPPTGFFASNINGNCTAPNTVIGATPAAHQMSAQGEVPAAKSELGASRVAQPDSQPLDSIHCALQESGASAGGGGRAAEATQNENGAQDNGGTGAGSQEPLSGENRYDGDKSTQKLNLDEELPLEAKAEREQRRNGLLQRSEQEMGKGEGGTEEGEAAEGVEEAVAVEVVKYAQDTEMDEPDKETESLDINLQPVKRHVEHGSVGLVDTSLVALAHIPEDNIRSTLYPEIIQETTKQQYGAQQDDPEINPTVGAADPTKGGSAGGPGAPPVASPSDVQAPGLGLPVETQKVFESDDMDVVMMGEMPGDLDTTGACAEDEEKSEENKLLFSPVPQVPPAKEHASFSSPSSLDDAQKVTEKKASADPVDGEAPPVESNEESMKGQEVARDEKLRPEDEPLASSQAIWEALFDRFISPTERPAMPPSQPPPHQHEKQPFKDAVEAALTPSHQAGRSLGLFGLDPVFRCDDIASYPDEDELIPDQPAHDDHAPMADISDPSHRHPGIGRRSSVLGVFDRTAKGDSPRTSQGRSMTETVSSTERVGLAELLPGYESGVTGGPYLNGPRGMDGSTGWKRYENTMYDRDDLDELLDTPYMGGH